MRADPTTPMARIALIGYGALSRYLLRQLTVLLPQAQFALVVRKLPVQAPANVALLTDAALLQAWQPTLLIECAGHGAVRDYAPAALRAGVDVIVASVGALADGALHTHLRDCAGAGGSRLIAIAGAMGGLDALKAARGAGLSRVRYIGRKPPMSWGGTPAADRFDLAALQVPTIIFEGSAGESARSYPKNANVTAAVALAGVGYEQTQVTLVADPNVKHNCHELEVIGAFGEFHIQMANAPLPENPKTSWLAALSIEAEVRHYFDISI